MTKPGQQGPHTAAIHGGIDPAEHRGAVSVPIYQTSTFAFPSAEEGAARFGGSSHGLIYSRLGNPTVQALEECVTQLEEGAGAVATATGMAGRQHRAPVASPSGRSHHRHATDLRRVAKADAENVRPLRHHLDLRPRC